MPPTEALKTDPAAALSGPGRAVTGAICAVLSPVLSRVVRGIAVRHPEIFDRLGLHGQSDFIIAPRELPFALHLRPDRAAPVLRAVPAAAPPPHDARIEGGFLLLLQLIDGDNDGDAAFFSRDLTITGNTEAVVTLRNALDDIEGSIAAEAADLFGRPGRAVLNRLRKRAQMKGFAQ